MKKLSLVISTLWGASLCACGGPSLDASLIDAGTVTPGTLSPYALSLTPAAVANSPTPTIHGQGTAGDTVRLYFSSHCTGSVMQTGTVSNLGSFALISPALTSDGPQNYSVQATHADGTLSCSNAAIQYILDRTGPLIATFPNNQTVSSVPMIIQFNLTDQYSSVVTPSATNANGALTFSGCSGNGGGPSAQLTATFDPSTGPLYTAHLSGGHCVDGDTLTITLHADKLYDSSGNAGLAANSLSVNYVLALTAPAFTLTRADGLSTPINSSDSLVFTIGFANASGGSTTLVTNPTNSFGQIALLNANAGCNANILMGSGMSGGTLTLSGCTSNGQLTIQIPNSLVSNFAAVAGTGNTTVGLTVDNTGPSITQALTPSGTTAGLDGANTLSFTVVDTNGVVPLSSNNSNHEVIVDGNCAVFPTVTTTSTNGSVYTLTVSGGTCDVGDTVIIMLDPTKIYDTAGNPDTADTQAAQTVLYTIVAQ